MKTVENIREAFTADQTAYFEYRNAFCANNDTLHSIYTNNRFNGSCTPADTVSALVDAIGYNNAVELIATLINTTHEDGRIARNVIAWAVAQDSAWDDESARRLGIYNNIHCAHLDQLGKAMMQYKPKPIHPKQISLDNGVHFMSAGEASTIIIRNNLWEAVVNVMDDETRELVHRELSALCTELEFLTRYLEIAPCDLTIG